MTNQIDSIHGLEILDSRGNPTVKAFVKTSHGGFCASVPSGASTGVHEAHELRDKDKRYNGKAVQQAVKNIEQINNKLKGMDCTDQQALDQAMIDLDGTEHKEKLGANAILAVSMACAKAGAKHNDMPLYAHLQSLAGTSNFTLPIPQLNIINSGKHAGIDNDVQEHMILPTDFSSFSEAIRAGVETYHTLRSMLKKKYGAQAILLGDEGGFAPPITSVYERLDLVMDAIKEAGYEDKMKIGLDAASSEFFKDGTYTIQDKTFSAGELVDFYQDLAKTYPVATIEDGMQEDDWEGWTQLHNAIGNKVQLVGDDLLVTNTKRIEQAIEKKACNALLLKVNQIGTVTESINAANMSTKQGWNVVVSHRSGETEDDFIADLVVGLGASQSKFGAPARSDRNAKYNRLLEIEHGLDKPTFQSL